MRQAQAWERLNDLDYSGNLSMDGFYNLLLEAGIKDKEAREAAKQRGWDRLQAGVMM